MKRYTIKDIAAQAGVSVTTVSRVINDQNDVSEETRKKVKAIIKRVGYVANASAQHLAGAKMNSIGLLMPGLGSGYSTEIIRGVAEAAAEAEYDLVLYAAHEPQGVGGKEKNILTLLTRGKVDGVVVILPRTVSQQLNRLWNSGIPVVIVDHRATGGTVPSVAATNFQGGLDGTRYLLGLGHQRIGFITGDLQVPAAIERLEGYKQALIDAGISVDDSIIVNGYFDTKSGYQAAQTLMKHEDPPTAIFASNDDSALGAMAAIKEMGFRIPEDISIIGFDDIPRAADSFPPLTTVRQPLVEMGKTAVEILVRILNRERITQNRIELPTKLIIRGSCARLQSRGR